MTHHHARADWRKSSYSNGQNGNCIEVAVNLDDVRLIRDSKDPGGPALVFGPMAFATFVDAVKAR